MAIDAKVSIAVVIGDIEKKTKAEKNGLVKTTEKQILF